jgi:hypothetical protein
MQPIHRGSRLTEYPLGKGSVVDEGNEHLISKSKRKTGSG